MSRRPPPGAQTEQGEPGPEGSAQDLQSLVGNEAIQEAMSETVALPHSGALEEQFGDLSDVTAHAGPATTELTEAVGAEAFAHDGHVFFGSESPTLECAFEEVAHVRQGGSTGDLGTAPIASVAHPAEKEASAAAAHPDQAPDLQEEADGGIHRKTLAPISSEVKVVTLKPGSYYTVTAADVKSGDRKKTAETIARKFGLVAETLMPFNTHVIEFSAVFPNVPDMHMEEELVVGAKLYIPSAEEQYFGECRKKTKTLAEAKKMYVKAKAQGNVKMLEAARYRATGQIGKGYGEPGVGQAFFTPNPRIAYASRRRSKMVNGQREYKVNWGLDFWKCSVFAQDVVYQAGFKPKLGSNKQPIVAGRIHQSRNFKKISHKEAMPGDLFQRWGGYKTNDSHNAVLASFVRVKPVDSKWEEWSFDIIGAEQDRAAGSTRTHTVAKGTNKNDQGKILRFLRPTKKRR
jgi:hypothetical protein